MVLDLSALKSVNMLVPNVTLADLEETVSNSVVDLLVATGVAVTAGVCLAGLEGMVTRRELVCDILKVRLCVFV